MNNFQNKLPAYTYIPGKTPHPTSDPLGHSYGESVTESHDLETCFRRGVFLFENQYYWEAHEAWEQAWILLGRQGEQADFVKGLIKLAASGVKCLEESPRGAQRHLLRAQELLNSDRDLQIVFAEWMPRHESLILVIQNKVNALSQ